MHTPSELLPGSRATGKLARQLVSMRLGAHAHDPTAGLNVRRPARCRCGVCSCLRWLLRRLESELSFVHASLGSKQISNHDPDKTWGPLWGP